MTLEVVDAEVGHLLAIQAIYAHWVTHGLASFEEIAPDLAEMDRRRLDVQERNLPYLAALDGALIQGFAYAGPYRPRSGYRYTVEDSVYVAPQALGRGVGRALLGEVIRRSENRGLRQMLAVIGDSANRASISLHEALGFRHAGSFRSVGFKHGRWVDSVLMQRALGQGDNSLPHESKLNQSKLMRPGAA